MANILLVHGAWFGSWCWYRLAPALESAGHMPILIDLPGREASASKGEVPTVQNFIDHVCKALEETEEPVYLAAHCVGGITATEVAERMPEKIAGVIYISGLFSAPGTPHPPLHADSLARQARRIVDMGQYQVIRPDMEVELLYHDCPEDMLPEIQGRLCREICDLTSPPLDTPQYWQNMPRAYIMTLQNPGLSIAQQKELVEQHNLSPVVEMNTNHCPFFSDPTGLANHIDQIISDMVQADTPPNKTMANTASAIIQSLN